MPETKQNTTEDEAWKNYLETNKELIKQYIFKINPEMVGELFEFNYKVRSNYYLYDSLHLYCNMYIVADFYENIYNLDRKEALKKGLSVGKNMMDIFLNIFIDTYNEWGEKFGLKKKFRIKTMEKKDIIQELKNIDKGGKIPSNILVPKNAVTNMISMTILAKIELLHNLLEDELNEQAMENAMTILNSLGEDLSKLI